MKEITKEEMQKLIDRKIIRSSENGFVDKRGNTTGYYRTKHRRYIEDKYVDIAQKIK